MSSVNSMEQFQTYFGLEVAETGTSLVFVSLLPYTMIPSLTRRVSILSVKYAHSSSTSTYPTKLDGDGLCSCRTCCSEPDSLPVNTGN